MEIVYVKEGRFFITKTGWFLLNDELTKVNMDFTNDVNYLGFAKLEESIKYHLENVNRAVYNSDSFSKSSVNGVRSEEEISDN